MLQHFWETILPDQNTFPFLGRSLAGSGWSADAAYWISLSPLRLLFCGHAAVAVFFVLSGFALAKSLQSTNRGTYRQFAVRRICRIYPPFAVVILAAAAFCFMLDPGPIPGMDWVNLSWNEPLTWRLVAGHLAMLVTAGAYSSLDSPMWTLVHELRISLFFPLLAAAVFVRPRTALLTALAVFSVFSIRQLTTCLASLVAADLLREMAVSWIETARYVLFFVLGILIAAHYAAMARFLGEHSHVRRAAWPLAFLCLAVPYIKAYLEIFFAAGAFLVILLVIHSRIAKALLGHASLRWLGRVSYSLYLSHQVVLLAMVHLLHRDLPIGAILMLVLAASLIIADILNRLVELPSIALGKRLATAVI